MIVAKAIRPPTFLASYLSGISMQYLRVKNWSKFQQYKDRNPPWIKLHFEILTSLDWVALSDASRLLMIMCLLVASRYRGHVPYDASYMRRVCHLKYVNFNPLIGIGYLEKTQADVTKWLAETETDQRHKQNQSKPEEKTEIGSVNGFLHSSGLVGGSGFLPTLETADKLMAVAPGWDQHKLIEIYNDWQRGKERPSVPQAAFLGWARKFTKGQLPR